VKAELGNTVSDYVVSLEVVMVTIMKTYPKYIFNCSGAKPPIIIAAEYITHVCYAKC
jgi:hypothetical protein